MATAYVFVQAEPQMANKVRSDVLRLPGVRSVEEVTGPYDIVVVAEGRDLQELHDVVIGSMQAIEGAPPRAAMRGKGSIMDFRRRR
jgi:DNA-binding Lrp family transcriptional regulator